MSSSTRSGAWVRWWIGVLAGLGLVLLLGACGGGLRVGGVPQVEVPPYAEAYSTEARSGGVRGGGAASDAEELLEAELAARGDEAEPDGALAAAAAWALRGAYAEKVSDMRAVMSMAQRFGFTGLVAGYLVAPLDRANAPEVMRQLVQQVPKNTPVNRYGIVAGQGSDVAVVIGVVQVELEEFPRELAPGGSLRLVGEVDPRYERASVLSTSPEGKVREIPLASRAIDATLELTSRGTHMLEIMGYGASGPVVLVNVPIRVGSPDHEEELADAGEADPTLTPGDAERSMLTLLNAERQRQGLGPVQPDEELRSVASSHSVDMAEHGFFSHVSPTTGSPGDRASHVRVSKLGECVALDITPARAHRGLLGSPAHRAAMLDPAFTHVGVGIAFEKSGAGQRRLYATLLFGRRPPPEDARLSVTSVIEAIHEARRTQGLGRVRVDKRLAAVATAGSRAIQRRAVQTLVEAQRAMAADPALRRAVGGVGRPVCTLVLEIIDRYQLTTLPLVARPELASIGVSTYDVEDEKGARLGVVLAAEAGPKQTLRCE